MYTIAQDALNTNEIWKRQQQQQHERSFNCKPFYLTGIRFPQPPIEPSIEPPRGTPGFVSIPLNPTVKLNHPPLRFVNAGTSQPLTEANHHGTTPQESTLFLQECNRKLAVQNDVQPGTVGHRENVNFRTGISISKRAPIISRTLDLAYAQALPSRLYVDEMAFFNVPVKITSQVRQ